MKMSVSQIPRAPPRLLTEIDEAVKFRMKAFERDFEENQDIEWVEQPFNWDDCNVLKIALDFLEELKDFETQNLRRYFE
jgi:hypothetical protein